MRRGTCWFVDSGGQSGELEAKVRCPFSLLRARFGRIATMDGMAASSRVDTTMCDGPVLLLLPGRRRVLKGIICSHILVICSLILILDETFLTIGAVTMAFFGFYAILWLSFLIPGR